MATAAKAKWFNLYHVAELPSSLTGRGSVQVQIIERKIQLRVFVFFMQYTVNFVISHCCFAEDGNGIN